MKFIIIGGGQDGIIFSYLISKLNGAEGEILINKKKSTLTNYYLPVKEIGSFVKQENYKFIEEFITSYNPNYVINTAAISSTKECNNKSLLAYEINTNFVQKLANFSKNKTYKLIHLGSSLEDQERPNCTYTYTKKLATNYILKTNNPNAICFKLPNHESPLRDERFFMRELINIFQKRIFYNTDLTINLIDGTVKRDWTWAPHLLKILLETMIGENHRVNYKDISRSLTLTEFALCTANIFNLRDIKIYCKKSGFINFKDDEIPFIDERTCSWIKKLILTKKSDMYNLKKWCFSEFN